MIFRTRIPIAALSMLLAGSAWAQRAQIAGKVLDPSGAAVPDASISISNSQTGAHRNVSTSDEGNYTVPMLPPGSYDIVVNKEGFKPASRRGIELQVNDKVTVDFKLEIGSQAEVVTVEAEVPLLRTQDAQTGEVINSLMVQNLPQLNRNPLELLRLAGNISGSGLLAGSVADQQMADTRINGGRTGTIEYLVDGATAVSGKGHGVPLSAVPSMEMVGEFKVITNGISAEYGRTSGGVVEVVTKGGTNELHGQAFEYFRNELFNANSWLQNQIAEYVPGRKAERTAFKQNDYGFTAGGPVYIPGLYNGRNRSFFLFDFEQFKFRQGGVLQLASVPTTAERSGDLTGTMYNNTHVLMYDPLGAVTDIGNQQFVKQTLLGGDGMHVPASRMDAFARRILATVPMPNRAPTPGFSQQNDYAAPQDTRQDRTSWTARLDQNIGNNHRLAFRFARANYNNGVTQWFSELDPASGQRWNGSLSSVLSWDWTASSSTVMTTRFSAMHHPRDNGPNWPGDFSLSDWELDPQYKSLIGENMFNVRTFTWVADSGWCAPLTNNSFQFPAFDHLSNVSASAAITKVYGRHTAKAGAEQRRYYDNHGEALLGFLYYGARPLAKRNYGDPLWTGEQPPDQLKAGSWGSFLMGLPEQVTGQSMMTLSSNLNYYAAYIQDDWRVTPRLTLNLGLRWDVETPMTERHDKITAWDPGAPSYFRINPGWSWQGALSAAGLSAAQISALPVPGWAQSGGFPNGRIVVANSPEYKSRKLQKYHPWQFAPRLGVAYQLTPSLVLRSSFGAMYLTRTGDYWMSWPNLWAADQGSSAGDGDRSPINGNLPYSSAKMLPDNEYTRYQRSTAETNFTASNSNLYNINAHTPREYNWSFGLQKQLHGFLIEGSYNGNHSGDLLASDVINPFPGTLMKPEYQSLFATKVANPVAGQIQASTTYTQATVPLGSLFLDNPTRGYLTINGLNIGRSNYHAMNLRLERRMSKGYAFLVNYTLSRSKDNVGGLDGQGGKTYQSTDTIENVYDYSPLDETHRLAFYHDVQLPFGRGRRFLGTPGGAAGRLLDGVVGGWEIAGNAVIRSGRPIVFAFQGNTISADSGVPILWGSVAGGMEAAANPSFKENSQVLRGTNDPVPAVSRFDGAAFTKPAGMTRGNIPPIWAGIRNPGRINYDAAVMKKFPLFREERFIQLRLEAENLFNIRGFGAYNTTYGDPNFGLITAAGNVERRMQISARIVF